MKRATMERREGPEADRRGTRRSARLRCTGISRGRKPFEKSGRLGWILTACVLFQCTPSPLQVGQKAPDFVLEDLQGGSVSLQELRGKVVFLHFWATWCPPCLVELPGLVRFFEGLEKGKCALLAVCVDNQRPARIRDFLQSWGTEIPVYLDPGGSLARRFGTVRFPETYVLDPEGRVCSKVIGPGDWNMSKWAHILHACAGQANMDRTGADPVS